MSETKQTDAPDCGQCGAAAADRKCCTLPRCAYCAECGYGSTTDFPDRVQIVMDEYAIVREGLAHEGPKLLHLLMESKMSLREISRTTMLSATYLSMVHTGQKVISPGAFLRLVELKGSLALRR